MATPKSKSRVVYLDLTHVGRHVTGIERIAIELFEKVDFAQAEVRPVRAAGTVSMLLKQQVWLPMLALLNPHAAFVFPGFPPSPLFVLARNRTTVYIHDLFLLTRRQDLSRKAKLYMSWPFRVAVSRLKYFFVNSEKTGNELAPFARADACIALYRPKVRNVFSLSAEGRAARPNSPRPLKLVSVGTVEPRKNYQNAADIRDQLALRLARPIELHIIGRDGWGGAGQAISQRPGVTVHGYLPADNVKAALEDADIYLCTSFDEGLGLPLLEAQYAGLPVVAPDAPVFREVLGTSGHLYAEHDVDAAVRIIEAMLSDDDWRHTTSQASLDNVGRWNAAASADLAHSQTMFANANHHVVLAGASAQKA
jgi:glycosyltransferase involved in cell wall biosynthesis